MKRLISLSVLSLTLAFTSSLTQAADNGVPSYEGTWKITPAENAMGSRASTVTLNTGSSGSGYFDAAPGTKYSVQWGQDNEQKYVYWYLLRSEGEDGNRAFRYSWEQNGGYSCVVAAPASSPDFQCSKDFQDYNFSMSK